MPPSSGTSNREEQSPPLPFGILASLAFPAGSKPPPSPSSSSSSRAREIPNTAISPAALPLLLQAPESSSQGIAGDLDPGMAFVSRQAPSAAGLAVLSAMETSPRGQCNAAPSHGAVDSPNDAPHNLLLVRPSLADKTTLQPEAHQSRADRCESGLSRAIGLWFTSLI